MDKLITFIVPTRNLAHLRGQLDHFEKTTSDCSKIEFLVKIDSDHVGAQAFLEEQIKSRPFKIRYISTPRIDGTFSLWIAVEQLFGMVEKNSYFVQILSDEPYFITPNWDKVLEKYIGLFPDHVFRLRLSDVKFNNYASSYECAFRCDSFPLYTRRWLELTEGTGDCWGSDAYQQLVAFHLSLGTGAYTNFYRLDSICRDIPVLDLKMGGLDFGVGVSPEMQKERHLRNLKEWNRLSTHKMQEHFSYLARRMYCYIWAKQMNLKTFQLVRDTQRKIVKVIEPDNQIFFERSYKVQWFIVFGQNVLRNALTLYWLQLSPATARYYQLLRTSKVKLINLFTKLKQTVLLMFKSFLGYLQSGLRLLYKKLLMIKNIRFHTGWKRRFTSILREIYDVCAAFMSEYESKFKLPSMEPKKENEFLMFDSPGISVLYKKKYRLSPGVKEPSEEDKKIALLIIDELQDNREKYRSMEFRSGEMI